MWINAGLTLLSQTEQRVDGHCQHAEPTQQRWGGRAGRHALCRGRQWRHQLPQLCRTIQPQDQRLGRGGPHEHTQVGALSNVILLSPEKYFWKVGHPYKSIDPNSLAVNTKSMFFLFMSENRQWHCLVLYLGNIPLKLKLRFVLPSVNDAFLSKAEIQIQSLSVMSNVLPCCDYFTF